MCSHLDTLPQCGEQTDRNDNMLTERKQRSYAANLNSAVSSADTDTNLIVHHSHSVHVDAVYRMTVMNDER